MLSSKPCVTQWEIYMLDKNPLKILSTLADTNCELKTRDERDNHSNDPLPFSSCSSVFPDHSVFPTATIRILTNTGLRFSTGYCPFLMDLRAFLIISGTMTASNKPPQQVPDSHLQLSACHIHSFAQRSLKFIISRAISMIPSISTPICFFSWFDCHVPSRSDLENLKIIFDIFISSSLGFALHDLSCTASLYSFHAAKTLTISNNQRTARSLPCVNSPPYAATQFLHDAAPSFSTSISPDTPDSAQT